MRVKTTLLFTFVLLGILASCDTKEAVEPQPVFVDKVVKFEVFASGDHSNSYYANHDATIHLRIYRTDKIDMVEKLVFDSTFTRVLKDLPLKASKLVITKEITAVSEKDEWVSIGSGYSVGPHSYGAYVPFPAGELEKTEEIVL